MSLPINTLHVRSHEQGVQLVTGKRRGSARYFITLLDYVP